MHESKTCTRCRKPIAIFEQRFEFWPMGDTATALVWCPTCMPLMLMALLGRCAAGEELR